MNMLITTVDRNGHTTRSIGTAKDLSETRQEVVEVVEVSDERAFVLRSNSELLNPTELS